MEPIILALGKYAPLKIVALPTLLTTATWIVLRLRAITVVSTVIYAFVRQ